VDRSAAKRFFAASRPSSNRGGLESGYYDAAQFEENMSTHYGRMIHLDDRTIMFANPEDAAEYIDFDLTARS